MKLKRISQTSEDEFKKKKKKKKNHFFFFLKDKTIKKV